jgi:hypothetical protein
MANYKFKVGDLVIGNSRASTKYKITRTGTIWEVKGVSGDGTWITIDNNGENVGFCVSSEYFDLYRSSSRKKADNQPMFEGLNG